MNKLSTEDRRKVEEYRNKELGKYPRPSVTADIIAVRPAFSDLREDQWRENPKFAVEVLLIKRGVWPHKGMWALPGGFIRPDESVEEGARRELREETALRAHPLIPVGVFSDPGRDMRAWIISNAFVSVYGRGEGCNVKGGDDAASAKWLRVEGPRIAGGSFNLPFKDGDLELFAVRGKYDETEFGGGTVTEVAENPLAFDHAKIIAQAFIRMFSYDKRKLAFFFLPEKFTLSDYIGVYQYLTREPINQNNIPNLRRQLTSTRDPLLEVCEGEYEELGGRGHAAAKLYRKRI